MTDPQTLCTVQPLPEIFSRTVNKINYYCYYYILFMVMVTHTTLYTVQPLHAIVSTTANKNYYYYYL